MKKICLLAFITSMMFLSSNAQNLKFGHIDSQKLLDLMPEKDSSSKVLQKEYKEMEGILMDMQAEFNKKYQEYTEKQDSYSPVAKKAKEEELQQLQERIQNHQQTAQQDLQKRESELLKPIMDKAKKAIEDVAKDGGYIYIFDTSGGQLLYFSEKSTDIMSLVKKKLNIKDETLSPNPKTDTKK